MRNKIKYLNSLVFALLIISCNPNHIARVRLQKIRTVKIKIGATTEYHSRYLISYDDKLNNKEYLATINPHDNTIEFYNLRSCYYEFSVSLPKIDSIGTTASGFAIVNSDSIFVLYNDINILLLVNKNGTIINRWDINSLIKKGGDDSTDYEAYCNTRDLLLYGDNKILIHIGAFVHVPRYFDKPTELIVDLKNNVKPVKFSAYFPPIYHKGIDYRAYYDCPVLNANNQLVCSFQIDPRIYVMTNYDSAIGYQAKSNYLSGDFPTFDSKYATDRSYNDKFDIESGFYENLFYDPYRRFYYRIVTHPQKYINPDSTVNGYFDKTWSIIILDENFDILGEFAMPAKIYDFANIFVARSGLYISNNNVDNKNIDKNYFSFSIFNCIRDE